MARHVHPDSSTAERERPGRKTMSDPTDPGGVGAAQAERLALRVQPNLEPDGLLKLVVNK